MFQKNSVYTKCPLKKSILRRSFSKWTSYWCAWKMLNRFGISTRNLHTISYYIYNVFEFKPANVPEDMGGLIREAKIPVAFAEPDKVLGIVRE